MLVSSVVGVDVGDVAVVVGGEEGFVDVHLCETHILLLTGRWVVDHVSQRIRVYKRRIYHYLLYPHTNSYLTQLFLTLLIFVIIEVILRQWYIT